MAPEGTSYESMYAGSYGPLEPEYGSLFTGYRIPASYISAPTSIKTANQIAEVSARLNEGMVNVELQPFSSETGTTGVETMPKQHWTEIKQLGKLSGATFSLHAPPSIDPAGFTREGWSEDSRKQAELELKKNIDRAHEIDLEGNIPIVLHATSGIPSTTAPKPPGAPITEEDTVWAVDKETGRLGGVRREMEFVREGEKPRWFKPEEQLERHNKRQWDSQFSNIAWENARAGENIRISADIVKPFRKALEREEIKESDLLPEQRNAYSSLKMGQVMQDNMLSTLEQNYNRAMRLWPEEVKENPEMQKKLNGIRNDLADIEKRNLIESSPLEATEKIGHIIGRFHKIIKKNPPPLYTSTDSFAENKSKETIANAALYAYKKFGDKAPVLAIENFFAGTVHSEGDQLKELLKQSRTTFIEKATQEGFSAGEANQAAEKLIGATWDVGHIALLRKHGFGMKKGKFDEREFKKIMAAQTKAIAPFVKHTHLTDNFGFEDSHLPPGMGEVPIKEMLRELEKAGVKGKKVIEAAVLPVVFKTSPTPYALEALGSPLYAAQMQPFWNQVRGQYGIPAGYSTGYGNMLPEQHFGTYGGGFSSLPMELGGKVAGKGQRFAGAPME